MILNRLIVPCGNKIEFSLEHSENSVKYELKDGERYYFAVSLPSEPFENLLTYQSDDGYFSVEADIADGEYVFEVGLMNDDGSRRVILPAVDERKRPLNQLLMLRRLTL